jgi:putative SOS response-associated peptidase YedK
MCYYNGQKLGQITQIRLLHLEKWLAEQELSDQLVINGFNYGNSWVLAPNKSKNQFEIKAMQWGFLPNYLKTEDEIQQFRKGFTDLNGQFKPPITTLNAVGEEVLLPNKIYREAALNQRCLVLSTGFFEWKQYFPLGKLGKPLKTPAKKPHYIYVQNQPYFFMAGIYNNWVNKQTGELTPTFAILTTQANPLMEQIHNTKKRMPVILPEKQAFEWLLEPLPEKEIQTLATYQFPAQEMEAYEVYKQFANSSDPYQKKPKDPEQGSIFA